MYEQARLLMEVEVSVRVRLATWLMRDWPGEIDGWTPDIFMFVSVREEFTAM